MPRGGAKPGERRGGRKKGTPNVVTRNAREAIAMLVESNAERMQGWLDEIAANEGPLVAWKCMKDVIEYHMPKLQRTELTGKDGGGIDLNINDPTRRAHRSAE